MRRFIVIGISLLVIAGCSYNSIEDIVDANVIYAYRCGASDASAEYTGEVPDDDCEEVHTILYKHGIKPKYARFYQSASPE